MALRVGLLLTGCGAHDGSDIHEAVFAALALERAGTRPVFLAPLGPQADVIDHATGMPSPEPVPREMLVESARLARGRVEPLAPETVSDLAALMVAGGAGSMKNLFDDFLVAGRRARLKPEPRAALERLLARQAPLGASGLAYGVLEDLAGEFVAEPLLAPADQAVFDSSRRIGWAPGFLTARSWSAAARGIDELVSGMVAWLRQAPGAGA